MSRFLLSRFLLITCSGEQDPHRGCGVPQPGAGRVRMLREPRGRGAPTGDVTGFIWDSESPREQGLGQMSHISGHLKNHHGCEAESRLRECAGPGESLPGRGSSKRWELINSVHI